MHKDEMPCAIFWLIVLLATSSEAAVARITLCSLKTDTFCSSQLCTCPHGGEHNLQGCAAWTELEWLGISLS